MHILLTITYYMHLIIYKKGFDVHTPKPKNFTN